MLKALRGCACAVVLLTGCGSSSASSSAGDARKAIEAYTNAVAANDAAAVCAQLAAGLQRQVLVAAGREGSGDAACTRALADGLKRNSVSAGPVHLDAITVRIHGDRADATTARRIAGTVQRTPITLSRQDGRWRIAAIGKERTDNGRIILRIVNDAMAPTLKLGARISVDPTAYRTRRPQVGDIIAFHPPTGADANACGDRGGPLQRLCAHASGGPGTQTFAKRIVAGPGDRIAILRGQVLRNGHPAAEPFITPCRDGTGCDFPKAITVPAGSYYVLGDNRGNSSDSRFWGAVPATAIIGKVAVV